MREAFVSVQEMFEIDRKAMQEYGIPSVVLMENAGHAVFKEALSMLKGIKGGRRGEVVCVCGKGKNGGDGFVCVRHLLNHGFNVTLFVTVEPESITGDARLNIEILKRMGIEPHVLKNSGRFEIFKKSLKNAALVIDAIFGIGFTGPLIEPQKSIISLINRLRRPVLSVDVPSGLDASSGKVSNGCIRAERTVTFALLKRGFLTFRGRCRAGKIIVADISIPTALLSRYKKER